MSENLKAKILIFFQNIEQYYECKTEITSGIYTINETFNAKNTTWNLSEFTLVRSAYRHNGSRLMIEGHKMYYEFSASAIIDFKHHKEHCYEIVESYAGVTFRITKIKFYIK